MPLNQKEVDRLLESELVAFLATSSVNGVPHVAPIWFIYHEGKIYFESDETTKKFKNLQKLNRIALAVGQREAYLLEGHVKWCRERELDFPIRKLFWDKYGKDMDDSYINDKTYLFEVIPDKIMSWHYAPDWD